MDTWRYQRNNAIFVNQSGTTGAVGATADYSGGITNGFRINWNPAPGTAILIPYLALKGGQYEVGDFAITSGTGNQDVTTAFDPTGVILLSNQSGSTNPASEEAHAALCVGASDGTNEGSSCTVDEDNTADSETVRSHSATKGLTFLSTAVNATASSTTIDLEADITLGTAKFTVGKTTNSDAQLARVLYVAFGSTPSAASTHPGWISNRGGWW